MIRSRYRVLLDLICILAAALLLPSIPNVHAASKIKRFNGRWHATGSRDGVTLTAGGSIRIYLFPHRDSFSCRVSGRLKGSGTYKQGKKSGGFGHRARPSGVFSGRNRRI
jgi:hypothetical protein